jgi:ribonuclease P protein component
MGLIVSRRIAARAVDRNQWKRRIRGLFTRGRIRIYSGAEIIIRAKTAKPSSFQLETDLKLVLCRLKALRSE